MENRQPKLRVMIADDMEPIRRLYAKIINQTDDMEVVSSVGTGKDAVSEAESIRPDVVLMDIEMETNDAGIRATSEILDALPETKIIILTVYEEDELITTAFQLGVCGYILKNAKPEEITNAIRQAARDESPMSPEVSAKVVRELKRAGMYETSLLMAVDLLSGLTQTELDTLRLLMDGKTRKEICEIRHVEMSTVKSQIRQILRKFNKGTMEEVIRTIRDLKLEDFVVKILERSTGTGANR